MSLHCIRFSGYGLQRGCSRFEAPGFLTSVPHWQCCLAPHSMSILSTWPTWMQGQIKVMQLDLADLASVKKFSKAYRAEERGPDLLILNAGVMACPQTYTKDGFEMQIGM